VRVQRCVVHCARRVTLCPEVAPNGRTGHADDAYCASGPTTGVISLQNLLLARSVRTCSSDANGMSPDCCVKPGTLLREKIAAGYWRRIMPQVMSRSAPSSAAASPALPSSVIAGPGNRPRR
jgi:hypothetical protein